MSLLAALERDSRWRLAFAALALVLALHVRAASASPLGVDSLEAVVAPHSSRALPLALVRPDRLQHLSFAFASGLALGLVVDDPAAAAGGSLGLGITKEVLDRRTSGFDRFDLLADLLGAGLAAWAVSALRR